VSPFPPPRGPRSARRSSDFPLGDAIETFVRREDAERFVEAIRGDEPELARHLRIEERDLEAAKGRSLAG
jgi:hypothetical protein